MDSINKFLISYILSFADIHSIQQCALVCKQFNKAIHNDLLWLLLFKRYNKDYQYYKSIFRSQSIKDAFLNFYNLNVIKDRYKLVQSINELYSSSIIILSVNKGILLIIKSLNKYRSSNVKQFKCPFNGNILTCKCLYRNNILKCSVVKKVN
jgi:hypothetical protein